MPKANNKNKIVSQMKQKNKYVNTENRVVVIKGLPWYLSW